MLTKRGANGMVRPTRLLLGAFKLPGHLYKRGLGWMLGRRFLMLKHIGRKSGRVYSTVVNVVWYDKVSNTTVVSSGWGESSDWYRNIQAQPALEVQTGGERYKPQQRFLDSEQSYRIFRAYRRRYPVVSRIIPRWFAAMYGLRYDGGEAASRELVSQWRLVAFRPVADRPAQKP